MSKRKENKQRKMAEKRRAKRAPRPSVAVRRERVAREPERLTRPLRPRTAFKEQRTLSADEFISLRKAGAIRVNDEAAWERLIAALNGGARYPSEELQKIVPDGAIEFVGLRSVLSR